MADYTNENAKLFTSLGLKWTTDEWSLSAFIKEASSFNGLTVLDFGCGPGRLTPFLKSLNPSSLVGVDRDDAMMGLARKNDLGINLVRATGNEDHLPFRDGSFDVVFSSYVFCEESSQEKLTHITKNLHRVLKEEGCFYMIVPNPDALGAQFKSYHYPNYPGVKDGDPITCHIHTDPPFTIADTWWSLRTYDSLFRRCGFEIEKKLMPKATGPGWRDETRVAPDVLYRLRKPKALTAATV